MKIKVIVKANSKENRLIKYDENYKAYRVETKAKPIEGKANIEVEKILGKHFKKKAKIVSGFTNKNKIVELT